MDDAKKSKNSEKFESLRNKICLSIAVLFTIWALFYSKALPLIAGREYVHFPNYLTYIFYKNDLNNAEYQKKFNETKDDFYQKKAIVSNMLPAYQKMSKYYFSPFDDSIFAISKNGEKNIIFNQVEDVFYPWLKISQLDKINTAVYDDFFWSKCSEKLSMNMSMYSMYKVYESVGFELATVLGIGPYKEYYNYSRVGGLVQPAILVREYWYNKFQHIRSPLIHFGKGVSKKELKDIRYFVEHSCDVNYFFDFETMKYDAEEVEYYQLFLDREEHIHRLYKVRLKLGPQIQVLDFDEVK